MNKIRRFADLSKLQQLPNLYSLTLHGNPIENFPNYRFDKTDVTLCDNFGLRRKSILFKIFKSNPFLPAAQRLSLTLVWLGVVGVGKKTFVYFATWK